MSNELYHFNKNHDKLGRFTFSRGGGGLKVYNTKATPYKKEPEPMTDEELQAKVKRMNLEKQYNKLSKEVGPKTKSENLKKVVDEANQGLNQVKNIRREQARLERENRPRMDLSHMSDQEMRTRINRELLERQYDSLFNNANVSRGKVDVDRVLNVAGTVLGVTGTALAIAVSIHELRK